MALQLHSGGSVTSNSGDVRITATGGAQGQGPDSKIEADELGIVSTAEVLLGTGPNDVNTLAIDSSGQVTFRDDDGFAVGAVTSDSIGCCSFAGATGINSNGGDITLTGDWTTGGDIDIQGDIMAGGGNVTIENFRMITLDYTPLDMDVTVSTTGTGEVTLRACRNILMKRNSKITTETGDVILEANLAITPVPGNFIGIELQGNPGDTINGAEVTTTGGSITVEGIGGNDAGGGQLGVVLRDGSRIRAGATEPVAGTVTVTGTGGPSAGAGNHGVVVTTSSTITSSVGNVMVTGDGGGLSSIGTSSGRGVAVTGWRHHFRRRARTFRRRQCGSDRRWWAGRRQSEPGRLRSGRGFEDHDRRITCLHRWWPDGHRHGWR